jgi:hypothetical protein
LRKFRLDVRVATFSLTIGAIPMVGEDCMKLSDTRRLNPQARKHTDVLVSKERTGVSLLGSAFGAGIFYGSLAFVISPIFAVVWFATRVSSISESAILVLISSPLWFAILGALFGALTAYIYNVLVRTMAMPFSTQVKESNDKEDSMAVGY